MSGVREGRRRREEGGERVMGPANNREEGGKRR